MQNKIKLTIIVLAGLLLMSFGFLVYTVTATDPDVQTAGKLTQFYTELFTFAFSLATVCGYGLRRKFGVRELQRMHLRASIRQGLWIATMAVAAFIMQYFRQFSLINSAFLIVAFVFLEFYFVTNENKTNNFESDN